METLQVHICPDSFAWSINKKEIINPKFQTVSKNISEMLHCANIETESEIVKYSNPHQRFAFLL